MPLPPIPTHLRAWIVAPNPEVTTVKAATLEKDKPIIFQVCSVPPPKRTPPRVSPCFPTCFPLFSSPTLHPTPHVLLSQKKGNKMHYAGWVVQSNSNSVRVKGVMQYVSSFWRRNSV